MNRCITMTVIAVAVPVLALANDTREYLCTQSELVRRVEIVSEPGAEVPCEVHYFKDTEAPGERQVLWRAQNQAGYCESMTSEFIGRLRDLGWDCKPASESDADDGDDTDALAPADDEIELNEPH